MMNVVLFFVVFKNTYDLYIFILLNDNFFIYESKFYSFFKFFYDTGYVVFIFVIFCIIFLGLMVDYVF